METKTLAVLIIGGYGQVGRRIAALLATSARYAVTIGGRDKDKAESTAASLGQKIKGISFDITSLGEKEREILKEYHVVIVCVDQADTTFAAYCLSQSLLYLDITAHTDFSTQLKKLDSFAVQHKALAVPGLGLCPGLTNLFARALIERNPDAEEIVTGVLLGLGDQYGKAAVAWTLENYLHDFVYNGQLIPSFEQGRDFCFPGMTGKRKAYRFNFSDQHALKESYPHLEFATYLCLDSHLVTHIFYTLRKTGVVKLIHIKPVKELLIHGLAKVSAGKKIYAVISHACRVGKVIDSLSVTGEEESAITAKVTVACLEQLTRKPPGYGVKDIQAVLSLQDLEKHMEEYFRKN